MLRKFLDGVSGPILVVVDTWTPRPDGLPEDVSVAVDGRGVVPGRWAAVVCLAADAGALRRLAGLLPALGKTRALALALVESDRAVVLVPREEWPEVTALVARTPGSGAVTVVRFARPRNGILPGRGFPNWAFARLPRRGRGRPPRFRVAQRAARQPLRFPLVRDAGLDERMVAGAGPLHLVPLTLRTDGPHAPLLVVDGH